MTRVAILTDNDFDKVNGVTTTFKAVLQHAPPDLSPRIYTTSDADIATREYLSLPSLGVGLPWYREMRIYWPRIVKFGQHLRADHAQVLHVSTPGPMGLAARWLSRRHALPMTGSYHTHFGAYVARLSGRDWLGRGMEQYTKWIYAGCHPVLVPSRSTADDLVTAGYPRDRLQFWPRGVDTDRFSPARRSAAMRESWRVEDRQPAIVYAGRVSREKGLALLPDIMNRLYRLRVPHRLIVVGDGPMSAELRARCPEAVFMGSVPHDQVAVAMASADVFLFPSETDSLGNVVLEAQASGIPVVVSNKGGPREYIDEGRTGRVAAGGNVEMFAQHLASYLQHRELRRAEGAHARALAMRHSWPEALLPLWQAWRLAANRSTAMTWKVSGPRARVIERLA